MTPVHRAVANAVANAVGQRRIRLRDNGDTDFLPVQWQARLSAAVLPVLTGR